MEEDDDPLDVYMREIEQQAAGLDDDGAVVRFCKGETLGDKSLVAAAPHSTLHKR